MTNYFSNLAGKLLIASPHAMRDNVFHQAIIYLVAHEAEGAIGLIINHPIKQLSNNNLFKKMNNSINFNDLELDVHLGGPMELERGFFLHSGEYKKNLLFKADANNLAVSSNLQIIKDIAKNIGPERVIFTIGYTGWGSGQLEKEIENNLWLLAELDVDLIFDRDHKNKWQKTLDQIGISKQTFLPYLTHC